MRHTIIPKHIGIKPINEMTPSELQAQELAFFSIDFTNPEEIAEASIPTLIYALDIYMGGTQADYKPYSTENKALSAIIIELWHRNYFDF